MPSTPEYHWDAEALARYHAGDLPESEAAALERAADQDAFLAAALAGGSQLSPDAFAKVQNRINKRSSGNSTSWVVGGSVVLLALAAWLFWPATPPAVLEAPIEQAALPTPTAPISTPEPTAVPPTIVQRSHTDSSVQVTVRRQVDRAQEPTMPEDYMLHEILLEDDMREHEPDLVLEATPADPELPKSEHRVYEIASYRVVDYGGMRATRLQSMPVQPGGLSPEYSHTSQTPDPLNRPERPQSMSYEQALELAVGHFAAGRYRIASWHFEDILKVYSTDVNAQFYLGMSAYHDQDYSLARTALMQASNNPVDAFAESGAYYAALAADAAGMRAEAVQELTTIANTGGFYAQRATEYLK